MGKMKDIFIILLLVAIVVELGYLINCCHRNGEVFDKVMWQFTQADTGRPWPPISYEGKLMGEIPMLDMNASMKSAMMYNACGTMMVVEMLDRRLPVIKEVETPLLKK